MLDPRRITACVPYFGGLDHEHLRAVRKLETECNVPFSSIHNCPYLEIARAELVRSALLRAECEVVFFIDHDIIFDPTDVVRVAEEALERNAVVGGTYAMRKPGGQLVTGFYGPDEITFFEGGGLKDVAWIGMGFTAIPRTVLEAIGGSMPVLDAGFTKVKPLFSLMLEDGCYFGEDVSFCRRVKRAGFDIYSDTRVRLYHKGNYCYSVEDAGIIVPTSQTLKAKVPGMPGAINNAET